MKELGLNYFDLVIAILLLWSAYKGFTKGFLIMAASLAALVLGVWGAIRFSDLTAGFLIQNLNLEGNGDYDIDTGVPFFDHMLTQIARHGFFGIKIKAIGDLEIDAEIAGNAGGKCGFSQARRSMQQHMIKGFISQTGRLDKDRLIEPRERRQRRLRAAGEHGPGDAGHGGLGDERRQAVFQPWAAAKWHHHDGQGRCAVGEGR